MSDKKLKLGWFTISDWKKEEEWLRKQHQNGWALVRYVPLCFYIFEKCPPEDVIYQLDYNNEPNNKAEYIQLFHDCGWEYLFDSMGYSYFRKPASQMEMPEEIFCDDQSRMDMIRRVFKGRMIPLIVLFLCCVVPNLFNTYYNAFTRGLFYVFIAIFIMYLVIFVNFALAYRRASRSLQL